MNVNLNFRLRQNEIRAAQHFLSRRDPNRIIAKELSDNRQREIRSLVTRIRASRSVTNTTSGDLNFYTVRPSGHGNIGGQLQQLLKLLAGDLPDFIRDQASNARLLIRYRPNIANKYASDQTLHLNVIANRSQGGEAFCQFIYYIDTPKRSTRLLNGTVRRENAPPSERGKLILSPTFGANRTPRVIVPKAGRIVFFPPTGVRHEVAAPLRNVPGDVDRNMIIGFLYRPMSANRPNINTQIRPFQNMFTGENTEATRSFTRAVRALSGVNLPTSTNRSGSSTNLGLASLMRRVNIRGRKRALTNASSPPASKRARTNNRT
jgi:hypothetical protein